MKPMLKELTLSIAFCGNCPNAILSYIDNYVSKYTCMKHFKDIDNAGQIPDWCGLPDKKYENSDY